MISNRWFLGADDISDALTIRDSVFVKELGCHEGHEFDALDKAALHLVLYADDIAVGCARMVSQDGYFKFGHIAVLKEHRGKHYGDLIMRLLLFKAFDIGAKEARLDALPKARVFYERFGFVRCADDTLDAGITRIPMKVTAEAVQYPSECQH